MRDSWLNINKAYVPPMNDALQLEPSTGDARPLKCFGKGKRRKRRTSGSPKRHVSADEYDEKTDQKGHHSKGKNVHRRGSDHGRGHKDGSDREDHRHRLKQRKSDKSNERRKWKGVAESVKEASQNVRKKFVSSGKQKKHEVVENAGKEYDTMPQTGVTKFFAGHDKTKELKNYSEKYSKLPGKGKNAFETETLGTGLLGENYIQNACPDYGTLNRPREFNPESQGEQKEDNTKAPIKLEDYATLQKGQTKAFFTGTGPKNQKDDKKPIKLTEYATLKHGNTTAFFVRK